MKNWRIYGLLSPMISKRDSSDIILCDHSVVFASLHNTMIF